METAFALIEKSISELKIDKSKSKPKKSQLEVIEEVESEVIRDLDVPQQVPILTQIQITEPTPPQQEAIPKPKGTRQRTKIPRYLIKEKHRSFVRFKNRVSEFS